MIGEVSFETKCVAYLIARSEHEEKPKTAPATGFFWRHNNNAHLITNRHVVTGKHSNNSLINNGFEPLFLDAYFYQRTGPSNDGLTPVEVASIRIDLWRDQNPSWIEHRDNRNFDVVALDLGSDLGVFAVNDKEQSVDIWSEAGADCFVVGFPEKLTGPAMTPVWKRGSIATEPSLDYDGLPIFLCDTATRPGMSGSPVFIKAIGDFGKEGGPRLESGFFGFWTKFVGVYAGRNGEEDDGFQLGRVWKAGIVEEMLASPKVPNPFIAGNR